MAVAPPGGGQIAIGGPNPQTGGDRTLTVAGVVRGQLFVWRFDPETGKPTDPVVLPLSLPQIAPLPEDRQATGQTPALPAPAPDDPFVVLAVSQDGRRVAAGTMSGTIRVWEVPTDGRAARRPESVGQQGRVTALAFTPDGNRVVSGERDGSVRIWDRRLNNTVVLTGHSAEVTTVYFRRDPPPAGGTPQSGPLRLITVGADGVRVWTLDREPLLKRAKALADQTLNEELPPPKGGG